MQAYWGRVLGKRTKGIATAIVLPTLVTFLYFIIFKDHWLQQPAFALKVLQFAFPMMWIALVLKERWQENGIAKLQLVESEVQSSAGNSSSWSQRTSIIFGIVMGFAVSLAMWFIYKSLPPEALEGLVSEARKKVREMKFDSLPRFIGLGVFYSLFHSFLEEYYFRWFVFGQLRRVTSFLPSMLICGLAFMAHHVIILFVYFGNTPLLAIFLSLSIAVGGMIWAWQYEKSRSLVGPWISHMIVDAGIFFIGYHVLFGAV